MDKLKMQTANKADENFKKLAAMFPNAVTETIDENGEVVRAIDKDVLMQEISCKVVDGNEERYQFTWPDKKKSVLLANAPINKTLRPCREESVDFDNTENLYIEGDNLEVLKLLQETYLGKIKMIYIDPPYNTGSDFVYDDDYSQNEEDYISSSGQKTEDGERLFQNTETNGRFHTDWLNMIYPRIKLAKDLLSEDGALFISIDDNEVTNLTKLCDEIFGANSRIALICHKSRASVSNDKIISPNHNTVLFYAKSRAVMESQRKMIGLDPVLEGFDNDEDCLIMDFFSGSSTTAHAVMNYNAETNGRRKFIMVQLKEAVNEKSEAFQNGYRDICEIGKERIRRAAKKIAEENPKAQFDGGFRVLKCDSSNMKEVYYNPAEYEPSLFSRLEDNIKEDRTPEDLLFQVMLDLGILLSSKIEATTIAGKKVFNVEDNYLIACFDDNVTEEVITEIAKQKPYYFVMRDSSMANDSVATNFEQIFAAYSPDTVRKVL